MADGRRESETMARERCGQSSQHKVERRKLFGDGRGVIQREKSVRKRVTLAGRAVPLTHKTGGRKRTVGKVNQSGRVVDHPLRGEGERCARWMGGTGQAG